MNTEQILLSLGAGDYALPLEMAFIEFNVESFLQKSHCTAQIAVESAGFTKVRESLNYSVDGLMKTFGRHRITADECRRYGRMPGRPADQEAIANTIYGGGFGRKQLGNTEEGDGWCFIGRGLKQLTGRSNYLRCSMALYGDDRLILRPELLEEIPACARSAGWFWSANGLNQLAETDNIVAVTKTVNGGLNGLPERREWLKKAKAAFR